MKTILKRLCFILLFSSGLTLILASFVAPYNDNKGIWRVDTDFVFISYASDTEERSPDKVCNGETFTMRSEYFDEFPFLRESTLKITGETWIAFIKNITGQSFEDQKLICYEYQGEIYLVQAEFSLFKSSFSEKTTVYVTNTLMNKYRFVQASPELSDINKQEFPSIMKALVRRDKNLGLPGTFFNNLWKYEPAQVPLEEWRLFIHEYGIREIDGIAWFKYHSTPYRGEIRNTSAKEIIHIKNMNNILFYISLLCLISGLCLTRGLYVRKQGIMTTPPRIAMILDSIIIIIMILAMYLTIDYLLVKFLGVASVVVGSDEKFQFMSIFFVIFSLPVMSIYISSRAGQSIIIDSTGVIADGLFFKRTISWDDLSDVSLNEQQILRVREEFITPRKLQTALELTGTGDTRISINEPVRSIKTKIINELLNHAPDKWKDTIREKGSEW